MQSKIAALEAEIERESREIDQRRSNRIEHVSDDLTYSEFTATKTSYTAQGR